MNRVLSLCQQLPTPSSEAEAEGLDAESADYLVYPAGEDAEIATATDELSLVA